MSDSAPDTEQVLRLRHYDDGTWSVDVECPQGNTLHSEAGFQSKEEAQRAGTIWGAKQVALRTARKVFGDGGKTKL